MKVAAVLGGGIQGCCTALMLAQLGFRVRLYDKSNALLNRASMNQEGKIHLGFVYARDQSLRTARSMIESALHFAPVIESLLGHQVAWGEHLSRRYICAIHRDSTLSLNAHLAYFENLQALYDEISEDAGLHYFGRRPSRIWDTASCPAGMDGTSLQAVVQTEEVAVGPLFIREILMRAIEQQGEIEFFTSTEITAVEEQQQHLKIVGSHDGEEWSSKADIVVNCLWEGRNRIDRSMNMSDGIDWVTRIKYGFLLKSDERFRDLPSFVVTHGPYGGVVNYGSSNTLYATWYPACMTWFAREHELPPEQEMICDGHHPLEQVNRIFDHTTAALDHFAPGLSDLPLLRSLAGTIMGIGNSDISDSHSGLHRRFNTGIENKGHYFSIFTAKYTSAPFNVQQLKKLLTA